MIDLTAQLDALTSAAEAALDGGEAVQIGQIVIVRRHSSYVAERDGSVFTSWSGSDYGQRAVIREALFAAMGDQWLRANGGEP